MSALSVYNIGYQKYEPEYRRGAGIREHYCVIIFCQGTEAAREKPYILNGQMPNGKL